MALAGKHCAVVGATGIIGSHIARAFAGQGAVLSLLGRSALESRPRLEPLLAPYVPTVNAEDGHANAAILKHHRFIRLDVAQRDSIKQVFSGKNENNVC